MLFRSLAWVRDVDGPIEVASGIVPIQDVSTFRRFAIALPGLRACWMPSEGNVISFQDFLAVQEQEFPFRFEDKHTVGNGRRWQGTSSRSMGPHRQDKNYSEGGDGS